MNLDAAKQNFLEIKEVFDSLEIKFYINDGTLLGAVRHKGNFIPWENDMDLRIPAESRGSHICEAFQKKGFTCRKIVLYHSLISEYQIRKRGIHIDICLNYYYPPEDVNVSLSATPSIQNAVHPARFCREDYFIDFLGTTTLAPNPPEEALEWIYGKNWRIPNDKDYLSERTRVSLVKYIKYFIGNEMSEERVL